MNSFAAKRSREPVLIGFTEKFKLSCGNLYVTVNSDSDGLYEVFVMLGKPGGCLRGQMEALARSISLSLKSNVNPEDVIDQLKGIRCPEASAMESDSIRIQSCADAVAQTLEKAHKQFLERASLDKDNSD